MMIISDDAVKHRKEAAQQSFCPHHCHLSEATPMQMHEKHQHMPALLHMLPWWLQWEPLINLVVGGRSCGKAHSAGATAASAACRSVRRTRHLCSTQISPLLGPPWHHHGSDAAGREAEGRGAGMVSTLQHAESGDFFASCCVFSHM